jgi:hypothetical protein
MKMKTLKIKNKLCENAVIGHGLNLMTNEFDFSVGSRDYPEGEDDLSFTYIEGDLAIFDDVTYMVASIEAGYMVLENPETNEFYKITFADFAKYVQCF